MNIELVNNWYPVFIFIGGKTEPYLFFGVFADGKTWQIVEGEIGAFARFDIRAEVAAYYFAEHENFGNAVSIQRRIVAVAVVNGDKAGRHDIKACFFTGFFDDVVANGLIDIDPAARHGPAAVDFLDEQDFIILENYGARIYFRRLIARFIAEQILHFFFRQVGVLRHYFRRHFAEAGEAFMVEAVFRVGKTRLGDKLHLHCRSEPFHVFIRRFNAG